MLEKYIGRPTLGKYKRFLASKIKILSPGERHKQWDYPVFDDLPKELQIHLTTPLETEETRTAVCFAGDIYRNFISFYYLKKIRWDEEQVDVVSVDEEEHSSGAMYSFWIDSVALIPTEIINPRMKLALVHEKTLQKIDKEQKHRRAKLREKDEVMTNARRTRSSDDRRSAQSEFQKSEDYGNIDPGQEVAGEKKEIREPDRIEISSN